MNTKRRRETRKAELVETHNMALSIERLQGPPYAPARWKRALYHAVAMSGVGNEYARKIREALELP